MSSITPLDVLSKTKAECLQIYLRDNGKTYDKLVVGALIFNAKPDGVSKILMVKRAAHEKIFPNMSEIPVGKVEDSDRTIWGAVAREVHEATNMEVTNVIGFVKSFEYTLQRITAGEEEECPVSYTSLQLNYICEVASHGLTVNPEEHSEGGFVSLAEIRDLESTEKMHEWC